MFGELKFFIVDKTKVKDTLHYLMNQKSNAIMNMKMNFPLNLISRFKAIILEFILSFCYPNKQMRSHNFVSLYHLIFGKLLDKDHFLLKIIFDFLLTRLE